MSHVETLRPEFIEALLLLRNAISAGAHTANKRLADALTLLNYCVDELRQPDFQGLCRESPTNLRRKGIEREELSPSIYPESLVKPGIVTIVYHIRSAMEEERFGPRGRFIQLAIEQMGLNLPEDAIGEFSHLQSLPDEVLAAALEELVA